MTAVPRVDGAVAPVFGALAVLVMPLAFHGAAFAEHHNHPPQDIALHERSIRPGCARMIRAKLAATTRTATLPNLSWLAERGSPAAQDGLGADPGGEVRARPHRRTPPIARTVVATSA